jgi:hypothetical protein
MDTYILMLKITVRLMEGIFVHSTLLRAEDWAFTSENYIQK